MAQMVPLDATSGRPVSREVGYGITDVLDDMVGDIEETAPTTLEAVNQRVADLATTLAHDTHEACVWFEDAQDDRAFLRAQINMIRRDRRYFNIMAAAFERERRCMLTQLTTTLGRIQTLEAREPTHTDNLEDVDSSA
ncbi:hypothetical protein Tco_1216359 [Tanacetum coccineum]